jgi:hypothetical protein
MYKQYNQLICSKKASGGSNPPTHVVNIVNDLDILVISVYIYNVYKKISEITHFLENVFFSCNIFFSKMHINLLTMH